MCRTIAHRLLAAGRHLKPAALLPGAMLMATSAQAHHPMGGAVPGTFWQGLLSGLAHPVIALDHLAFVLALAMLMALSAKTWRQAAVPLLAFVGLATAGVLMQAALPPLRGVEWAVGAALLLVAGALWQWRAAAAKIKIRGLVAAMLAGLAHGLAYGEAVIGAEATPLGAYLVGLALVQAATMAAMLGLTLSFKAQRAPRLAALTRGLACAAGLAGLWVLGSVSLG